MSTAQTQLRVRLLLAQFVLDVDVSSSARWLGVFGPSGAGKSSLIETIAGWRKPVAGRIQVGGALLFDDAQRFTLPIERRGIGYVPQDALLWPHWSVRRNLRAGAARGGSTGVDEALVERTVAILEIASLLDRSTTQLSGGERQRVALARALVSRPSVLLLDEPLGSLDLPLRRRILPYLLRVQGEFGVPTVFVSHDATEVQALCEEVVVLEAGKVVAQGAPDETLRYVRSGQRAFENVLAGTISVKSASTATLRLDGGGNIQIPGRHLQAGARAVVALGSDELLIALDAPTRISARNVLPARIERVETTPDETARVDVRLEDGAGARLSASLTQASADELGLRPGQSAFLVFKTNSCRVLSMPIASAD